MNSGDFKWIVAPDVIAKGIEDYGAKALVAVQAAATYWGQYVQDQARLDANWENPTGNARGGIFFAVDGFDLGPVTGTVTPEAQSKMSDTTVESGDGNTLIITLGHTVFYGKFLELSNGGRFAVIMSTLEGNLSMLERSLQDIFK